MHHRTFPLIAACLLTARSDFLERAPVEDPYVQAALPPIPRPDKTMVVMTGDEPMGFIATTLPPQIPVLRIDGWINPQSEFHDPQFLSNGSPTPPSLNSAWERSAAVVAGHFTNAPCG